MKKEVKEIFREKREITRFKVEIPGERRIERYRIVKGQHDCDTIDTTYWIESWLPNTQKWTKTYNYHRWASITSLLDSPEYKNILRVNE